MGGIVSYEESLKCRTDAEREKFMRLSGDDHPGYISMYLDPLDDTDVRMEAGKTYLAFFMDDMDGGAGVYDFGFLGGGLREAVPGHQEYQILNNYTGRYETLSEAIGQKN